MREFANGIWVVLWIWKTGNIDAPPFSGVKSPRYPLSSNQNISILTSLPNRFKNPHQPAEYNQVETVRKKKNYEYSMRMITNSYLSTLITPTQGCERIAWTNTTSKYNLLVLVDSRIGQYVLGRFGGGVVHGGSPDAKRARFLFRFVCGLDVRNLIRSDK